MLVTSIFLYSLTMTTTLSSRITYMKTSPKLAFKQTFTRASSTKMPMSGYQSLLTYYSQ